jgi:hypothetical protein
LGLLYALLTPLLLLLPGRRNRVSRALLSCSLHSRCGPSSLMASGRLLLPLLPLVLLP